MEINLIKQEKDVLDKVVKLGTRNSKTLGHFPEGAYLEHAARGNLMCALDGQELLGYILFAITKSKGTIRVVQLCISDGQRNKGIAKSLLNAVKNRYQDSLKGVTLSCREDYVIASKFWKSYGFKAKNRVRSRSKKERYLVKWWYDFGNHDLFSLSNQETNKIKAVLDANILIKLRDKADNELTGVGFLMEDWLVDEVDYYYAPEIFNEILRDKDHRRAKASRAFITRFFEIKFNPDTRDSVFKKLCKIISGNTENDFSDKRQLAECISGEINYFITTDQNILDAYQKISDLYGVYVVRPTDFILDIDQNNNKSNYLSTRIAGVNYDHCQLKPMEIDRLTNHFLAREKGEKKHHLREIFTSIAGDVNNNQIKVLKDNEGRDLAVWASEILHDRLLIPILRVYKSKISGTLFKQLVFEILKLAVEKKKEIIIISDRYVQLDDYETLESLGFILRESTWMKIAISGVTNIYNIFSREAVNSIYDKEKVITKYDSMLTSIDFKVNIERKFWPAKFSNLDIPAYIIPIKPYWASQLFDSFAADELIFGAPPKLALNRENIYYRSVNPVSEKSPGRILWYSSSSKNKNVTRTKCIVGCSYLDEVHIGEAKKLFQKFRHFGIYEWDDVYKQAKCNAYNQIKALKFVDTEVFFKPIPLTKVNAILVRNSRKKNTFPSPLEVNKEVFLEIYKQGMEFDHE